MQGFPLQLYWPDVAVILCIISVTDAVQRSPHLLANFQLVKVSKWVFRAAKCSEGKVIGTFSQVFEGILFHPALARTHALPLFVLFASVRSRLALWLWSLPGCCLHILFAKSLGVVAKWQN